MNKGQLARLFDVFILGPYLAWYAATTETTKPQIFRAILFTMGVTTIIYNGYNFLANVYKFKGTIDTIMMVVFLIILLIVYYTLP